MAPQPGSLLVPARRKPSPTRSRSSTTPSRRPLPTADLSATRPESAARTPSFLSPVDLKPRPYQTLLDVTSSSRLHIPGTPGPHRLDHERRNPSRHRHTQRDLPGGSFRSHRRDRSEGLPHLKAGIAAERERKAEQAKLPNELWGARENDLRRIASNRSDRAGTGRRGIEEATNLRRANSDPKRRAQQSQRSPVEILLDRAEAQKMASRAAVSQKDVDKIRRTNAEAEEELHTRLATVNKTSMDITRRLDYTYYNLLEKVGNLVAIVQSFHSLSSQTKNLIDSFAKEASMLETDVKTKVETSKTSFDEREVRVRRLEERGARANAKARDLGARLENARQQVEAWEKKEGAERRRRSWFWRSTWTVLSVVLVVIFLGLTWRKWQSEAAIVRMALMDGNGRFEHRNQSQLLDGNAVKRMDVPGDVKSILSGVAERKSRRVGKPSPTKAKIEPASSLREDARLSILDEL